MTAKKHIKRIIIALLAALLSAILLWYYLPVRISDEIVVQNNDGQQMVLAAELTVHRCIFKRAKIEGTVRLGTEEYSAFGRYDDSPGSGIGQFIENLQGRYSYFTFFPYVKQLPMGESDEQETRQIMHAHMFFSISLREHGFRRVHFHDTNGNDWLDLAFWSGSGANG